MEKVNKLSVQQVHGIKNVALQNVIHLVIGHQEQHFVHFCLSLVNLAVHIANEVFVSGQIWNDVDLSSAHCQVFVIVNAHPAMVIHEEASFWDEKEFCLYLFNASLVPWLVLTRNTMAKPPSAITSWQESRHLVHRVNYQRVYKITVIWHHPYLVYPNSIPPQPPHGAFQQ